MALTDITGFSDDWASGRDIRIPAGLKRRALGIVLVLLAYGLWFLPVGLGAVTFVLIKLWLSCILLTRGLGLAMDPRGDAE